MKQHNKFFVAFLSLIFAFSSCTTDNVTSEISPENLQSNDKSEVLSSNYSGVELFRGIFQLEGEIPQKIEALAATQRTIDRIVKEHEAEEVFQEYNDRMFNFISEENPILFDDLEAAVASRNADDLARAVENITDIMKAFVVTEEIKATDVEIAEMFDFSKYDLTQNSDIEVFIADAKSIMKKNKNIINQPEGEVTQQRAIALAFFIVYAAVIWDVVAAVNYGAAVNVVAAVNAITEVNVKGFEDLLVGGGNGNGTYQAEKYVLDIFNLSK